MQDVIYLERIEQAETLLKPMRIEIVRRLAEPRSCTEVASEVNQTPQNVYYHVKRLEEAGLVEKVSERRVRGIVEGIYQARARSYWLSPRLVGQIGRRRTEGELSLGFLLGLAEELQADVAQLAGSTPEVPSLGLSAEVRLRPEQREEFLRDLRSSLEELLTRYGGGEGDAFRIAFACYPKQGDSA
jgi:DNA-binding transcriptional ArsR family regulator